MEHRRSWPWAGSDTWEGSCFCELSTAAIGETRQGWGNLRQRSTASHRYLPRPGTLAQAQSCLCLSRHWFPSEVQLSPGSYSGWSSWQWVSIRPNLPNKVFCPSLGNLPSTPFFLKLLTFPPGPTYKQIHSSRSSPELCPLSWGCVCGEWDAKCSQSASSWCTRQFSWLVGHL